jgi:hypothetical protein
MNPQGFNLFKNLTQRFSSADTRKKLLMIGYKLTKVSLTKNFSHLVTNALLFIDILRTNNT